MIGRPRSIKHDKFLALYLDPTKSQTEICKSFRLSKTTYYRYEQELDLPKVKIGIGCTLNFLKKTILNIKGQHINDPFLSYDIQMAKLLCQVLRLRGVIYFCEHQKLEEMAQEGKFDFALASLSKTNFRSKNFHFSNHYYKEIQPEGYLIKRRQQFEIFGRKPVLGCLEGTVHEIYAKANLINEFEVKVFRSQKILEKHFLIGKVDFILQHCLSYNELKRNETDVLSKKYNYKTTSGIIFPLGKDQYLQSVNKAVDLILDLNMISDPRL